MDFLDKVWPFYSLPIELGIPLLLIIIARLRGLGTKKGAQNKPAKVGDV